MSGRSARVKGASAEREVVDVLREHGWDAHRTPHSGALVWMPGDVTGTPWFIEVKRCEQTRIGEWMQKAIEQAGSKIALAADYDALCTKELLALAKLDSDPVRAEIDAALSVALGLSDMKPLRQLLAREPGLTGNPLSPKPGQAALFVDNDLGRDVTTQLRLVSDCS